jgi:hypothetical protein
MRAKLTVIALAAVLALGLIACAESTTVDGDGSPQDGVEDAGGADNSGSGSADEPSY